MELLVAAVSVVRVLPNSIEISYCEMTYIARFEPLEDVP
jgi:cell division septal protein FtsQ